jgi:hypothetical protein
MTADFSSELHDKYVFKRSKGDKVINNSFNLFSDEWQEI